MITTNRAYLWSFVTQIFCNDGHGGDCKSFEVMTSTQPLFLIFKISYEFR